ncbi:MAG TPA: ABC transporter [Acholeplasmatales bacterium]|nr:ABC transporter [Acholeplasmatales bacterium]
MLKLVNVTKNYLTGENTVKALKGISVEFRKNEFVSVLGPSGCGKTTLLNIIGGLDRYTSGDMFVNNKSTKDFTDSEWDSYRNFSIGFVFQTYNLITHISVLKNVELALTLSGISKTERKARALKALTDVGLADQVSKKPNQLSGGQMQRVAIARALVNNPDVLLADEPTGALDSTTSYQIMDILQSISKERLIIMVTHNPTISALYSTRVIKLLDGLIMDDSNPYVSEPKKVEKPAKKVRKEKTSMSFLTALSLSLGNLITKKARTILTAFAGSIGIIGIALVLALSNGFQSYIDKMEADTLSNYPLTVSNSSFDYNQIMNMRPGTDIPEYPADGVIKVNALSETMMDALISNDITAEYIDNVIKNIPKELLNGITYSYGANFNVYRELVIGADSYYPKINTGGNSAMFGQWTEMIEDDTLADKFAFLKTQYDVLEGHFPTSPSEIVLVVDSYNQITDITLMNLGFYNASSTDTYRYSDFLGYKCKLILNDALYGFDGTKFVPNYSDLSEATLLNSAAVYNDANTVELEIVGIIRVNVDTSSGAIAGSIGYTKGLTDLMLSDSLNSEIVTWMNEPGHETLDPFSGLPYLAAETTVEEQHLAALEFLGGVATPYQVNIFPIDFDAKEVIKTYLDEENAKANAAAVAKYYADLGITPDQATSAQAEAAKTAGTKAEIYYTDLVATLVSSINTVIKSISYVLIAFTAVSLVVSSIMIGIITYISVLERTKEIGILRSIGARKKDISRVFNAETLIIGFTAGLFGVVITLVLIIPINLILNHYVDIPNLAVLKIYHGLLLVVISMALTLIAGIIPSRIAAKRDPVVALRTE